MFKYLRTYAFHNNFYGPNPETETNIIDFFKNSQILKLL